MKGINLPAQGKTARRVDVTRRTPYLGEGKVVPPPGLGPGTSRLAGGCSLPMSYRGWTLWVGAGGCWGCYSRPRLQASPPVHDLARSRAFASVSHPAYVLSSDALTYVGRVFPALGESLPADGDRRYAVDMSNSVAEERRRLRNRLTQLDDERVKITYALEVLDRIEPETATSAARSTRTDRPAGSSILGARPGGTFERAVRIINSSGRTWRVEELVHAMREDGWSAQVRSEVETVRSALSRAVRDGLVTRLSQGVYAPPEPTPPLDQAADETPQDADAKVQSHDDEVPV
jgi:hypothetical protein